MYTVEQLGMMVYCKVYNYLSLFIEQQCNSALYNVNKWLFIIQCTSIFVLYNVQLKLFSVECENMPVCSPMYSYKCTLYYAQV